MRAQTEAPTRSKHQSDDETEFWNRWPRASRYWTADEREMIQAYIPGWVPGCDIGSLCAMNSAKDGVWRAPLWFEWDHIRTAWPSMIYLPPAGAFLGEIRGKLQEQS